jgi:hypothetical protein
MCRYATTRYKPHFACFTCHKAFKRRLKDDVDRAGDDHPARCPQCALLMADMGLDFAPPTIDDEKAWATLAALYSVGETFHSCGCNGPGYRPRDPSQLRSFFEERKKTYIEQLHAWSKEEAVTPERKAMRDAAIATWRERIARLGSAMTMGQPG